MNSKQEGVLTDVTILFFIREHPASGYDIRKMIAHDRVYRWIQVSPATIYGSLRRLETQGLVTAAASRLGNYPSKTLYAITPAGIAFYNAQVELFLQDGERESRLVGIGLSCARLLPAATVTAALRVRAGRLREHLDWVKHRLDHYPELGGMQFPEWIHLARAKKLLNAEIAWTEDFANRYAEIR